MYRHTLPIYIVCWTIAALLHFPTGWLIVAMILAIGGDILIRRQRSKRAQLQRDWNEAKP